MCKPFFFGVLAIMDMILYSADPREPALRQKLNDLLGSTDAATLVRWVKETHAAQEISFGDALALIVEQSEIQGIKFAHNLLEVAYKPREIREMELAIFGWAKPRIEKAAAVVLGHRGNQEVAKKEYADLCVGLMEKLHHLFPDKHDAVLRGAVVLAFTHKNGQFSLDTAALVKAVNTPMPMEMERGSTDRT